MTERKKLAARQATKAALEAADIQRSGSRLRQWSVQSSECRQLEKFGIISMGYSRVGPGYKVLRRNPSFSNINVTLSGRGKCLIDGKWRMIKEGEAILSPAGTLHGSHSIPGSPWEFYWICFSEHKGVAAKIKVAKPTITHIDPKPIHWAMESVHREFQQTQQQAIMDGLLQVIDLQVKRITAPWHTENRLWKLWDAVAEATEVEWTTDKLAASAKTSPRNLLRLCKKELGRSLHEQLTHIRFTKASLLLQEDAIKLQEVAQAVGYNDAFAFSKAFKKWAGVPPSEYREG